LPIFTLASTLLAGAPCGALRLALFPSLVFSFVACSIANCIILQMSSCKLYRFANCTILLLTCGLCFLLQWWIVRYGLITSSINPNLREFLQVRAHLAGLTSDEVSLRVPVFMLLCAVPFANTLVMRVQPKSIGEIKSPALIPNYSYYPPIDENTDVILELTDYLDEEIGLKGKTACLVASSLRLNYDTLMNAEISLSVKPKHEIQRISYIKTIPEVDRRDGFTETLFETDYIITTDKAELHLAPEEQKSISIPNSLILSGTGFGAAYEKKDKSFAFPDGTQILIYKRTREITPEEKQEVLQKISG